MHPGKSAGGSMPSEVALQGLPENPYQVTPGATARTPAEKTPPMDTVPKPAVLPQSQEMRSVSARLKHREPTPNEPLLHRDPRQQARKRG